MPQAVPKGSVLHRAEARRAAHAAFETEKKWMGRGKQHIPDQHQGIAPRQ